MALHGDIKINGVLIMSWSAQSMGEAEPVGTGRRRYQCEAWLPTGARTAFEVRHYRHDGAAVLAAKALMAAASLGWLGTEVPLAQSPRLKAMAEGADGTG